MVLLIDNYDSFSYNLYQLIGSIRPDIRVIRNDELTVKEIDELKSEIMSATKLVEVEDLYRPYKEKKKTKATEAIKNGLEPLAKIIMSFPANGDINTLAEKYINENVKTVSSAIEGAKYIISEWISDNASYRKYIRKTTYFEGIIKSTVKDKEKDVDHVYEMYYDFSEPVRFIKSHRVLAINRGEANKILSVSIIVDTDKIIKYLEDKIIKKESFVNPYIKEAILDSYKRLISPSIEREIRSELKEKAEEVAIDNFGKNLEKLLLTPPMKEKMVLGFDPAYRTGCKLAVIDKTGKKIDIRVIYPHEPRNEKVYSKKVLLDLIKEYNIDIIAIGNGTASRESEEFVADVIKESDRKVEYIIVNEAGASVYSASKLAISEFPDLHVEERSAISIGRRLQDPLAELVKIDPESIGVGLYQHDVSDKRLSESLDFVVSKAVNQVGVNINTASASLLKYVSGVNKKVIDKILDYRDNKGKINSRKELEKLLSDKVYEQAIGFLRIVDGDNILDETSIHPESYNTALKLLDELGYTVCDIGTSSLVEKLDNIDLSTYKDKLNTDIYTLEDIVSSLKKPSRDPRDEMPKPILKSDVMHLEDLKKGMKLEGTVRNVAPFGVFVDVGLHNDGLIHISKLSDHFVKDPMEIVSVGDIVTCYVDDILLDKKKVSLSLIEPK